MNKLLYKKLWIIFFLFFFPGAIFSAASLQITDNTQNVKAVFIYNFTRYMSWMHQDSFTRFDIAVIGESKIIELLNQIALKRKVNQQNIYIRQLKDTAQIKDCQILFIPESEKLQLSNIVEQVQGKNILTVSEIEGAIADGIMINFLISEKTIKFEINLQAMKESNFQPSSQLLKLAVRVIE